jgi:hypothetical protein
MDNVQTQENFISKPSSQTFKSYLLYHVLSVNFHVNRVARPVNYTPYILYTYYTLYWVGFLSRG